jgi:hypothetical protein
MRRAGLGSGSMSPTAFRAFDRRQSAQDRFAVSKTRNRAGAAVQYVSEHGRRWVLGITVAGELTRLSASLRGLLRPCTSSRTAD